MSPYEFEIVHITELVAELIREGSCSSTVPIERVARTTTCAG